MEDGGGKGGKVTGRELVEVISPSTLHLSPGWTESAARHLLVLAEGEAGQLGVCFVDLSVGCFHVGEMAADTARTQLTLLLCHVDPVEVTSRWVTLTSRWVTLTARWVTLTSRGGVTRIRC